MLKITKENENNNQSSEDKDEDFLEKLHVHRIGKDIYITEYNTVITKYTNNGSKLDIEEEVSFNDFIKKTRKIIKKDDKYKKIFVDDKWKMKFDKENNKFYLIKFNEAYALRYAHEIVFDEEIMKNYLLGIDEEIPKQLQMLCDETTKKEAKEKMLKDNKEQLEEVKEKVSFSHDLLTPYEAHLYLEYLNELKKDNRKTIRKDLISGVINTSIPVSIGSFCGKLIYSDSGSIVGSIALGAAVGVAVSSLSTDIYASYKLDYKNEAFPYDDENDYLPCGIGTVLYDLYLLKDIVEKLNDNKRLRIKAKGINKKQPKANKVVESTGKIEEVKDIEVNSINSEDSLINRIEVLINKIKVLDVNNKKLLLEETKKILEDYIKRYSYIKNKDNNTIDIISDNYDNLYNDTLKRIINMEFIIEESKERNIEINKINESLNDAYLLVDHIDDLIQLNNIDQDLDKVHENTLKKVKVKKLEDRVQEREMKKA